MHNSLRFLNIEGLWNELRQFFILNQNLIFLELFNLYLFFLHSMKINIFILLHSKHGGV